MERKLSAPNPSIAMNMTSLNKQHSTVVSAEQGPEIADLNPTLVETGENKDCDAAKGEPRETMYRLCCPGQRKSQFFYTAIENPEKRQ